MEKNTDTYVAEMLVEAMELLEDLNHKMELFQRQEFFKLKDKHLRHKRINNELGKVLRMITDN